MVAGFSDGEKQSEAWTVLFQNPGVRPQPVLTVARDQVGRAATPRPRQLTDSSMATKRGLRLP